MPKRADWQKAIASSLHNELTTNNWYFSPYSTYIYLKGNDHVSIRDQDSSLVITLRRNSLTGEFKPLISYVVKISRNVVTTTTTYMDGKTSKNQLTGATSQSNMYLDADKIGKLLYEDINRTAFLDLPTNQTAEFTPLNYISLINTELLSQLVNQGYPVQDGYLYFQPDVAPQVISVDRQEYLITVIGTNRETPRVTYAYRILVREGVATVQDFSDNYPITKEQRDLITKPLPQTNNHLVAYAFVDEFVSTLLQVLPPQF